MKTPLFVQNARAEFLIFFKEFIKKLLLANSASSAFHSLYSLSSFSFPQNLLSGSF